MPAPTILQKIADERRADVETARNERPLADLIADARSTVARGSRLSEALKRPGLSVIAEVKRASPSKGRF